MVTSSTIFVMDSACVGVTAVAGTITLKVVFAIFGKLRTSDVAETADNITFPAVSFTCISEILRFSLFFNNCNFWRVENDTLFIFAPDIFAFVRLAFVRLAFVRFARVKFAFIKDEPEASILVRVDPDKSALSKFELRTTVPDKSERDIDEPVNVDPFIFELLNDALVSSAFVKFEFVIVVLLKLVLVRMEDTNVVPFIVELDIDAPVKLTLLKLLLDVNDEL